MGRVAHCSCRSCGTHLSDIRQRYCSQKCIDSLFWQLWVAEGLLSALDCRFATFHWDDKDIILQILPSRGKTAFCFVHGRHFAGKPVVDLKKLIFDLGAKWWRKKKITRSHTAASMHLLSNANSRNTLSQFNVLYKSIVRAKGVATQDLDALRLEHSDLLVNNAGGVIKTAYRKSAMKHHPDRGGSSDAFRNIQDAYKKLMEWSEHPAVELNAQAGLPDRWLYDSMKRQWTPPCQ